MAMIVHVIDTLDPAAGGPQAVVTRLAAAQAALGHDVHIASYSCEADELRVAAATAAIPHYGKVQNHLVPRGGWRERIFAAVGREHLKAILTRVDMVHLHGVWEPLVKAAADLAHRQGIPFCLCPHGMLDPWSLSQKATKKRVALAIGYRRMLERAAFLHALNFDEARLLAPLALTAPLKIIPNGVFLDEFDTVPNPTLERNKVEFSKKYILFMGRLHFKKGLDYLIDAFVIVAEADPSVDLVIAGPDGGARCALETSIRSSRHANRIHVVGPLYGVAKLDVLTGAACFCLPSRQEGFSVAILEAMTCRVPVVISEECRFPEVSTAAAGEVVPLNGKAFAEALLRILADETKRKVMGGNARALVADGYVWPIIAEATLAAYGPACSSATSSLR